MVLYYRDDAVQVTSEAIHAGGHVVRLADIAYVWHARGATTLAVRGRVLGRGVLLLHTPDALRFGQIYRAVQRAVEQQGERR